MSRDILIHLAIACEDQTCGECRNLDAPSRCRVFGKKVARVGIVPQRLPECLAAESAARFSVEELARAAEPQVIGVEFDFPIANWHRAKSRQAVGELADFCTELSEEDCCACWLTNQSYYLWSGEVITVSIEQTLELQRLHDEAGGWLHWFGDDEPGRFHGGLTFIPTDEWLPMFEAWAARGVGREAVLRG